MNIVKNQKIYFVGEKLPYKVIAISDRYAVVSRKLNKRQDADLLHHRVEKGAYNTFTEAFNDNKENPIYSLIDFHINFRAPHNPIFKFLDYSDEINCEKAIKMLESGEIELSHKNNTSLNIDWERTKIK